MNVKETLTERVEAAFRALGYEGPAVVQAASRPEFGDYQANGVMGVAKRAKANPREVAAAVVEALDLDGIARTVEVAGPGFLNITLDPAWLARNRAGEVTAAAAPQRVVVDYSAPNLAKEMHVGHLRSSVIGDCIARVLEARGHTVLRQNHVGDWGTQFGMLLTYMTETGEDSDELADLEDFYRAAKRRFDEDEAFRDRARDAVVALQGGEAFAREQWQRFITISLSHCQEIYDRLGLTLKPEHTQGESAYNDMLAGVVESLAEQGLLTESDGAQCVFLDEFTSKKGDPLPVIVQKTGGGYLYATTDLAAVIYRTETLGANRVLYFTDARQALHFRQIFAVAAAAGFNRTDAVFEHMPFGTMLGADGKPFKTREGGVVKFADLIDEAQTRAADLIREKNPQLDGDTVAEIARVIGVGAIKYADLSKNRNSDYMFDWDTMLSFDGNTAPYLLYAYARIRSLFRRGDIDPASLPSEAVAVDEPERRLAVTLAGFNDTLAQVATEGLPHYLCAYLFELATRFTQFYEACPILSSDDDVKLRRLSLAGQTADTLARGLDLLGVEVVERM